MNRNTAADQPNGNHNTPESAPVDSIGPRSWQCVGLRLEGLSYGDFEHFDQVVADSCRSLDIKLDYIGFSRHRTYTGNQSTRDDLGGICGFKPCPQDKGRELAQAVKDAFPGFTCWLYTEPEA